MCGERRCGMIDTDLWVFAYGSLMWRPGFEHEEAVAATIYGFHRAMCVLSHHYRGTPEAPGLVLGLDRGGSCRGKVLRVAAANRAQVLAYLHERELISGVYAPRFVKAVLDDGRRVEAYAFLAERRHEQYAGDITLERMANMIRSGVGSAGTAREYLANTVDHLDAIGLTDSTLHRLLRLVDEGEAG